MDALSTLNQIREKRVEDAQFAVLHAHQVLKEKETKKKEAEKTHADYIIELPKLVDVLYQDIIGKKMDVIGLQELVSEEARLNQHLEVLRVAEKKAIEEAEEALQHLAQAQKNMLHQERKRDAMKELIKKQSIQDNKDLQKRQGKEYDELASSRWRTKHLQNV